ncbi:zinc-finger of the MIZ type in Nse subunit-domain-containing protein [Calycina marina]|uniref:Zinc-finger of the MIZ type in Nse subunit-domain-containing protein n=1 Tax=Calycina marina TaxID=1763456 RepID=A0A9P7ZBU9_9HELO|nr:zinc-finger of the MIZ type in Nse subunit-domain-containing protein [Calycina marina]
MSRRLVQNGSRQGESSALAPASRRPQYDAESLNLPPYEAPSRPLTEKARRELIKLRDTDSDLRVYKKHLDYSLKTIPQAVAQLNDKANKRKMANEKWLADRTANSKQNDDKTEAEKEEELTTKLLVKQGKEMTESAEKVFRDIIDYRDELEMQGKIVDVVIEGISAVPPLALDAMEDAEEGEEEEREQEAEALPEVTGAVELLHKARKDYHESYQSKSMVQKYADNNSAYNTFKMLVHDSMYGDTVTMPKATAWFHGDTPDVFYGSSTQNRNAGEDDYMADENSGDEIVIAGSKNEYKCPLTFAVFVDPFTSKVCQHTFEKANIIDYINKNGKGTGNAKQVQCPQSGCGSMVSKDVLYDDELIRRKVKRMLEQEARDDEEDEGEEAVELERPSVRAMVTQTTRSLLKRECLSGEPSAGPLISTQMQPSELEKATQSSEMED